MKRVSIILLITGIFMTVISLIVPCVLIAQRGPDGGIIGGAGWPTYWFLLRQNSLWMTELGAEMAIIGAVLPAIRRKKE